MHSRDGVEKAPTSIAIPDKVTADRVSIRVPGQSQT